MNESQVPDPDFEAEDAEDRDDAVIGKALRWSLVMLLSIALAGSGVVWWTLRPDPVPTTAETILTRPEVRTAPAVVIPNLPFTDVTREAGITFVHENGAYGDKLLPETMGGGAAFFDFDGDGDQDILFVNSRRWPDDPRGEASSPATLALYANDGTGAFTDVTAGSGLDVSLYGMGVATGDYDSDGRVDVFISGLGSNRMFRNLGEGHFEDVTESAGVAGGEQEWSTSCGWFDYDGDGDLDLFVLNYVQWSKEFDLAQNFQLIGGGRAYGRPQVFPGTFPYLYRNDGDGRFTDVSDEAGVQVKNPATGVPMGKSLGLVFADFDADGWLDIVVANDTVQNFLFRNLGNGAFEEIGASSGVAFDPDGNARGAMGIDTARFRGGDEFGIAIGNFANEMTALYVSSGNDLQFTDEAVPTGLGPQTRLELTFGVLFVDCDLDGRLDLFAANGHLEEEINRVQPSQFYEQPPQLFWNCGSEHETEFCPVPAAKAGEDFAARMVGRGAATADIDGDGDQDLLICAAGRAPRLLRNDQQLGHHWVRFELVGSPPNRDAIGAAVEVAVDGKILRRQVMPTRSYLSQSELPVTVGLGRSNQVENARIVWPDGSVQEVEVSEVDRTIRVEQDAKGS